MKTDIDQFNLTPCQAHRVLQIMLLGGAKDKKQARKGFRPPSAIFVFYLFFIFSDSKINLHIE